MSVTPTWKLGCLNIHAVPRYNFEATSLEVSEHGGCEIGARVGETASGERGAGDGENGFLRDFELGVDVDKEGVCTAQGVEGCLLDVRYVCFCRPEYPCNPLPT